MLVTVCSDSGKALKSVADVMCGLAANSGLMQVTLTDHDMEQMVKD